jgi:hypothetical protein
LCIVAYVGKIAIERCKQMPASKGKSFVLQNYWKFLENSGKWKLREQEAPQRKEAMDQLVDDDCDVEGGRNKNNPNYYKKAK